MDTFNNVIKNKYIILGILIYSVISLLIIFYNHHYFDDEVHNLEMLSLSFTEIFNIVQYPEKFLKPLTLNVSNNILVFATGDIHSPLSYLLNKTIYSLFSSYKAILVFSIFINVGALSYFYHYAEKKLADKYSKLLLFIFVFLNGGILMWTNSVRWYAYWVPLFIILYTFLLKHQKLDTKKLVIVGLLLSLMTYISYLTFLLIISLFILFLISRRNDLSFKNILISGALYFSLCLYQLFIFIEVYAQNIESQTLGVIASTLSAIYGFLNGGSVFPANPVLIFFSFFTLIIMVLGIKTILANNKAIDLTIIQSIVLFVGFISLMIITGISGKYRNVIALSIPFYFIISYFITYIKSVNIKRVYLFSALILSVISVFNLITHQDTTKNSYNLPISKLSVFLQNPNNKFVITYDYATYFYLKNKNYDFRMLQYEYPKRIIEKGTSIYLIRTYGGSLRDQQSKEVSQLYEKIERCMQKVHKKEIGIDKYYMIKNKLADIDKKTKKNPKLPRIQMNITYGKVKERCSLISHQFLKGFS